MIPPHLLRDLQYLEITTARAIRTARPGSYTSRSRGSGFDFDQHLPYRPGDDVRRIDWNVTARIGAPYVRQTHAERDLDVILAIDTSPSMQLGTPGRSKKDAMTLVTAALLFSAGSDQINTGFLVFADDVLRWSAPRRASGRTWHLLEELWATQSQAPVTTLIPALRHLLTNLKTTSVVVLLSDFYAHDQPFDSPELRTLASLHDVITVVVETPVDTALPPGRGAIRIRDAESGRALTLALNERSRRAFAAAVSERRRSITDACYRLGMEAVFVHTDDPVVRPLIDLFRRRRKRP